MARLTDFGEISWFGWAFGGMMVFCGLAHACLYRFPFP